MYKLRLMKRDRGHYIVINGKAHHDDDDISVLNIYVSKIRLQNLQKKYYFFLNQKYIVGDFIIQLMWDHALVHSKDLSFMLV